MLLFHDVVIRLQSLRRDIYSRLQYVHLVNLFAAIQRLSPLILAHASRRTVGVPDLQESVRLSLAHILGLSSEDIDALWDAFGDIALHSPSTDLLPNQSTLDRTLSTLSTVHPVGMPPSPQSLRRSHTVSLSPGGPHLPQSCLHDGLVSRERQASQDSSQAIFGPLVHRSARCHSCPRGDPVLQRYLSHPSSVPSVPILIHDTLYSMPNHLSPDVLRNSGRLTAVRATIPSCLPDHH